MSLHFVSGTMFMHSESRVSKAGVILFYCTISVLCALLFLCYLPSSILHHQVVMLDEAYCTQYVQEKANVSLGRKEV